MNSIHPDISDDIITKQLEVTSFLNLLSDCDENIDINDVIVLSKVYAKKAKEVYVELISL